MDFVQSPDFVDPEARTVLLNCDVIEGMKRIADSSVDLVITSPPYWNAIQYNDNETLIGQSYEDYIEWMGQVWAESFRLLRPNGKLVINTPIMPVPKAIINQTPRHIKNICFDIENWINSNTDFYRFSMFIWQKQTSKMMFGSYPFPPNIFENNTIEFLAVYVKPGEPKKVPPKIKEANKLMQQEWLDLAQQIWFMYPANVKREFHHPAPFPQKLPARFMKMYTFGASEDYEGDVVLDPFNGAGTTTAVAKMLKRRGIGIELSSEYHRIAKKRAEHTLWGQDLNWLVGRPVFPSSDELDELRLQVAEAPKATDKDKAEKKHKRKTYGRGLGTIEPTQTDMFGVKETDN